MPSEDFGELIGGRALSLAETDLRLRVGGPAGTVRARVEARSAGESVAEANQGWNAGPRAGEPWRRASTMREFTRRALEAHPESLSAHLRRRDFSRWIADVFGDPPLAHQVREIEDEHPQGRDASEATHDVVRAIRSRDEHTQPEPPQR